MSYKNRGISSLHCRRNPVMHVTDRRRPACQKSKNCRKRLPGASNEFRTEPGQRPADVADRRNPNSRLLLRRASRLAVFQSGRLWRAIIHPLNTPDRPQPTRHRRLRTHGSRLLIFSAKELAGLRLPSDHGVRLPDGATLVAGSFQTFIGNFRPELFQFRRCRLAGVPFSIIFSPGHWRLQF